MAATALGGFLDRVRAAAGPADDPRPDATLLAAFADRRDPAAFTALVRRHAELVWAVCLRVTGDRHAAEDAFQAVWLVLARKAAGVRPRHSLGGWLHRTAVHVSLKARAMTDRRRRREGEPLPDAAAPLPPDPPDPALLAALDEEIARLPDALRAAVVLCELEGVPRKPAAAQLGIAEGTLSSRLASARKRLADRLRRRGFGAVGVAGLLAAGTGGATVPPRLLATAVGLGGGGAVPDPVRILTEEVIRAMFLSKLKLTVAVCGLALAATVGLWPASTPRAVAQPPAKPKPAATTKPTPPREGVILTSSYHKEVTARLLTPDGTPLKTFSWPGRAELLNCTLAPDRAWIAAFVARRHDPDDRSPWSRLDLYVLPLDGSDPPGRPLLSDVRCSRVVWSPDGTKLYGSEIDPAAAQAINEDAAAGKPRKPTKFGDTLPMLSWAVDSKTGAKTPLALPAGHNIRDLSADGRTLLTICGGRTYLVPLATLTPRLVIDRPFSGRAVSPDGKWVVGVRLKEDEFGRGVFDGLTVVTVADQSESPVALPEEAAAAHNVGWSPDGKRLAVLWTVKRTEPPSDLPRLATDADLSPYRLTVCDPDGSNAKIILAPKYTQPITGVDWK